MLHPVVSIGSGCHDFTSMAVRRARRCPDNDLDRTGGPLPRASAVVALVRVFRPVGRCGNEPGGDASSALGARSMVWVVHAVDRMVVFAATTIRS